MEINWIDVLMKVFLILMALGFLCMMLVVCIIVIHYAVEERKERKNVRSIQGDRK